MPKGDPIPERRYTRRFPLQLPIAVCGTEEQRSRTLDISAGGVSFYLDSDVEVGTRIEFTIAFAAAALGSASDVKVNCVGRVVRCCKEGQQHAIAAVIDEYCFERA